MSSVENLEKKLTELNAQRDLLKQQSSLIQKELDNAKAEEMAAQVLAKMSDADRAAMAKVVNAGSIESGEKFGKVG